MIRRSFLAGALLGGVPATGRARSIRFKAPDGAPLTGEAYGNGPRGVILAPGAHGVGQTWSMQAQRLATAGFNVIALDYRGLGAAQGLTAPNGDKAHLDVLGAMDALQAAGANEISVVGASWGGWAAGGAALQAPGRIKRLALLAHSPIENIEAIGGRKLFVVARSDRDAAGRFRLEAVRQQYETASPPKTLVVLDGAAHAQFLFLTDQSERLYAEVANFLSVS